MAYINSKEEAFEVYKALIEQYGLRWTSQVPVRAWDRLNESILWLSIEDRRRAAGLPART